MMAELWSQETSIAEAEAIAASWKHFLSRDRQRILRTDIVQLLNKMKDVYEAARAQPQIPESVLICNNDECGWTGWHHESVHPKHDPSTLLCPECHETTEQMTPGWANSLLYLSKRPQPTMDDIIASNQELIVVLRATLAQPQPVAQWLDAPDETDRDYWFDGAGLFHGELINIQTSMYVKTNSIYRKLYASFDGFAFQVDDMRGKWYKRDKAPWRGEKGDNA